MKRLHFNYEKKNKLRPSGRCVGIDRCARERGATSGAAVQVTFALLLLPNVNDRTDRTMTAELERRRDVGGDDSFDRSLGAVLKGVTELLVLIL